MRWGLKNYVNNFCLTSLIFCFPYWSLISFVCPVCYFVYGLKCFWRHFQIFTLSSNKQIQWDAAVMQWRFEVSGLLILKCPSKWWSAVIFTNNHLMMKKHCINSKFGSLLNLMVLFLCLKSQRPEWCTFKNTNSLF